MTLKAPSAMQYHLLEQPLYVAIGLIVAGAILVIIGRQAASRRLLIAAQICALTAVAVFLLATFVHTQRERLIVSSRQLVELTAPLQLDRFAELLDGDVTLFGPDADPWLDRDGILRGIQSITTTYAIAEQRVDVLGAQVTDDRHGTSIVDVTTYPDPKATISYGPVRTRWLLQWSRADNSNNPQSTPWRVTEVHWLSHPAPNGLAPQRSLW